MLSYRIVDGDIDLDVTDAVRDSPELTWNAVGGCETARVKLDLPLSTFPSLGRRSRLFVTDEQGRPVWTGYCTDPGGVSDDNGEAFDLTADGSIVEASRRIGRLVYADREAGSWEQASVSATTAQVSQVNDDFTGWRIAHPQGQAIGTGAVAAIDYRLPPSDQSLGRFRATVKGGATDSGFTVRVTAFDGATVAASFTWPLSGSAMTVDLGIGDFGGTADAIQVALVRTGGATNVTTPFAYIDVSDLLIEGALVDQWGTAVAAGPLTSARVVADLAGRGMLGAVDPDAMTIADSGVVHTQLSWATGIRGAAALEELRKADPDMTWMYGARRAHGFEFSWVSWALQDEPRYDITTADEVTSTGSTELPGDRVMVLWTDSAKQQQITTVELPSAADGEFVRDLDPIILGESTAAEASAAGLDALTRSQDVGRTFTATIERTVLDRATGLELEPHELRPGCLARLEVTGETLRVHEVAYHDRDSAAVLTLGDPPSTTEDRMLAVIRGEVSPTAPLVPPVEKVVPPPATNAPKNPDLEDQVQGALTAANGKNKVTGATRAPNSGDPGQEGDTWYYFVGGNIYAVYTYSSGAWTQRKIRDEVIDTLTVGKIVGLDAAFLNAKIDYLTSVDITSSTFKTATSGQRIVLDGAGVIKAYDASDNLGTFGLNGSNFSFDKTVVVGGNGVRTSVINSLSGSPLSISASQTMSLYANGAGFDIGDASTNITVIGNLSFLPGRTITGLGSLTATEIYNTTTDTGTGSPNVLIRSGGKMVPTSGSSERFKDNIAPITGLTPEQVYNFAPVQWNYKPEHCTDGRLMYGFTGEEAERRGLGNFVDYDDGEVVDFNYARFSAAQQIAIRDLNQRCIDLAARVEALEAAR